MLKNFYRSISAMALAALIAGLITIAPGSSEQGIASAPLNSGKSDRLDIRPLGTKCSEQAWPNFEASCLRDKRQAMGQAKAVRVVSTVRVVR